MAAVVKNAIMAGERKYEAERNCDHFANYLRSNSKNKLGIERSMLDTQ